MKKKACLDYLYRLYKLNIDFLLQHNTIVSLLLICINTYGLIKYHENHISVIITIISVIFYFFLYKSTFKKKLVMFLVLLTFSILTIIGEHYVIKISKSKALNYGSKILNTNVPSWLFTAYFNMLLLIWLLTNFFDKNVFFFIKNKT